MNCPYCGDNAVSAPHLESSYVICDVYGAVSRLKDDDELRPLTVEEEQLVYTIIQAVATLKDGGSWSDYAQQLIPKAKS